MTNQQAIWLATILGWIGHIILYIYLPRLTLWREEQKKFRDQVIHEVQVMKQDHVEIALMLRATKDE